MAYKAPIWEDGKSPAISAENLNNLSQAAEGAQVLYGNSAPTSSTKGAVGQFYLVVVADSDGNYPLYQCVAIANGSYTWRDTRRIPDSITSMLGIPAPGTINRALNVLANIGNLHVWERARKTSESIPSGYTLGDIESGYIQSSTGTSSDYRPVGSYGNSLSVNAAGVASIESPNSAVYAYSSTGANSAQNQLAGKFLKSDTDPPGGVTVPNEILYFPPDATFSYITNGKSLGYPGNYCIVADKFQRVHPYAETPPGTTTDYLTSTDRNAYPDQSAEGGEPEKPAHYTLDEAETVDVLSSSADYTATLYSCDLDSVLVNNDGSISTTNFSVNRSGSNIFNSPGSWVPFSPTKAYYIKSGSNNVVFTDTIFTVSEETTLTYSGGKYVLQGCRKLIGHAKIEAIPANTAITYMGQLGGGARIEVGSYVGTGTYGESNPCSITLSKDSAIVFILRNGVFAGVLSKCASDAGGYSVTGTSSGSGYSYYSFLSLYVSASGNTISWYHKSGTEQLNAIGENYTWVALIIG